MVSWSRFDSDPEASTLSASRTALSASGPWAPIAGLLDETWYVDIPDALRVERLTNRHVQFGRSADEATAWVEHTDEPNARLIEASRGRASFVFRWEED